MPEALVALTTIQISSQSFSENESSSTTSGVTDRSNDSGNNNRREEVCEKKLLSKAQGKSKMRKSCGRRSQKKPQLRPLISEKRVASVLKNKSHIPRAVVLTPSSSSTSITTSDSLPSPLIHAVKALTTEKRVESSESNSSCLVRQKSAVILAFRQRKSFSQMDFSHSRRQINFPIPSSPSRQKINCQDGNALVPSNCDDMTVDHSKNSFVHRMYNQDCYFGMPAPVTQMAGMKIFAVIMLNAWRKRRDEVRRLIEEVADLKRQATKTKNQLHVFNSLFRVEQKRNNELNYQLKKSLENVNLTKTSCESLTTSLISLKADKSLLEQQLQTKEHEFESISTLLTQTKSDLFKCMTVQRELQASLSSEQRKVQILENQKNELINEICDLNNETMLKEDELRKEIEAKCDEIYELNVQLNTAEQQIKAMNRSSEQMLMESKSREDRLKQEIESLENELKMMRKCLESTVGNRLKACWSSSMTYQKITLQILHWVAYCALPATPPPKIKSLPFGLSLDKVLSIVKR